jgi:electron transfer flavoprotein alpha subunit
MSIFAWVETLDGKPLTGSWEALAAARAMVDGGLPGPVVALVFGPQAGEIATQCAAYGADEAIIADDETLATFRVQPYAALLSSLVAQHQPAVVVAAGTIAARELLAFASVDADAAMASDVIGFTVDRADLVIEKPIYAGKALTEIRLASLTRFVALRGRAFKPLAADATRTASVTQTEPVMEAAAITSTITGREAVSDKVSLTDAAIVVSGGRGTANNPASPPADAGDAAVWKAQDGFAHTLQPLADVLGAAIGASRAAVDAGYIAYDHQVGQTGKQVNPDLYIACGISGAIQHLAGMRNSKVIVAINKDSEAPIFKLANYGIVGDLYEVVPALTAALKEKLG